MVDTSLKNQLVSVFEDPYLSTLKNAYTGYATKTTLELVQNLYLHYACISATDMSKSDEWLRSPYNAEDPLGGIIERLNKCTDFAAAASEPVSETQLVCIAYGIVADTGKYPEDCREWRT